MGRRTHASADSRWRQGNSTGRGTAGRRVVNPVELERRFFEFDRRIVAGVLNALREAIQKGAMQLEMVAEEQMFDASLSANVSNASRRLGRMQRKLEEILGDVSKATGYPPDVTAQPIGYGVVRQFPDRQRSGLS
jgi:hypothetical protein